MLALAIGVVVAFGLGFGAGRVKNQAKLAAVQAHIDAVKGKIVVDFQSVVEKIKKEL